MTLSKAGRDYIDRTIETVRNHREADNCWPQWANIFADEIEFLRGEVVALAERATELERELDKLRVWAHGINSQRDVYAGETTKWKGRWERTDDERQAQHQRAEQLEAALRWIEDFAARMRDRHTGFVHVERRARAALDGGTATPEPTE